MRPICFIISLVFVLLLGACSSTSPEPTRYLLRQAPSEGAGPLDSDFRVGLGRIVVAPYLLGSQGLVIETAPGEVRPARQHVWAEPLDAGLRWYLRGEIARALGHEVGGGLVDIASWDYTVDVYVGRLHGSMSGTALLEAAYVIRSAEDRAQLREYHYSKSTPLRGEGYAALVAAEQLLLSEFAGSIADSLRTAHGPVESGDGGTP